MDKGHNRSSVHVKETIDGVIHSGIDLLICDLPENQAVPVISPREVPAWNQRSKRVVPFLFAFAECNLADNGVILLIHGKDYALEPELEREMKKYKFRLVREWVGGNRLKLSSGRPTQPTVCTHLL